MSDEPTYEPDDSFFERPVGRKDFLLAGLSLGALAAAGPFLGAAENADAAIRASAPGGDPIASRAVAGAKQFSGVKINHTYEAGLQALDPKNFSGPLWKQLTGIDLAAVELSHPDQYSKPIAEHIARSGAYDLLDIEPAWIPAMADGGVISPIDDLVAKYKAQATFKDMHPLYSNLTRYKGKNWGFFDDGDTLALYYRKDVFADATLQKDYKAKFGKALRVPQSWDEYSQVAQFITDKMAPKVYGTANFRKFGGPGNQFAFLQQYRANGGKLFDASSMKALINGPQGIKTLQQMIAQNNASVPGNNNFDAVALWTAWLQWKVAMIYSWPPTGRMSENYSQRAKAINFIPRSQIVGKVGYAIMPGGHGEMASGYVKAVAADSKNREAAFLTALWMNSPSISTQRVELPYALRDPFRISHFKSARYRALWPAAKDYLINLNNAANGAVLDMIMPGWQDYALAVDRMCTAVWAGGSSSIGSELQKCAKAWDDITSKLGKDKQRAAYQQFQKLPGSSAANTIAARGQAVHLT